MTKLTLPILILIMLVISPLFFSVTELNGDDERVLINDLQISQQIDCTITVNINCKIDRLAFEDLTYREIFENNNYFTFDDLGFINQLQLINKTDLSASFKVLNTSTSSYWRLENQNYSQGDLYYTSYKMQANFNAQDPIFSLRFSALSDPFWYGSLYNANDIAIYSGINTVGSSNLNLFRVYHNTSDAQINDLIIVYYVYNIPLSIFTTEPTQQQLDQWLEYYLEHKDQGIINDFYHIQSDTLINMSYQAYNGIDNLIVRTNNFIDWLTLDVASLLSRSIGFLGDKTYEILDDIGIISNDFTWWADFNDSLPTWLKRLVGLE